MQQASLSYKYSFLLCKDKSNRSFLTRPLKNRVRQNILTKANVYSGNGEDAPLLVKAALGQRVERPPCWMMRQAGRYQQAYRDLAQKYPSFRQRSETTELIVETTLQPYESFKPDGVILFSDILTPLPAMGINFEIDDIKGPLIENTVKNMDQVKQLRPIETEQLQFVGESLSLLRKDISPNSALLGFVGAPWTLATYIIEGQSSTLYKTIKSMTYGEENQGILNALLSHLAKEIAEYVRFQLDSGADCIQIFDSWGGQLPADRWSQWSLPYIQQIIQSVKKTHPQHPITLYVNGCSSLLERMQQSGADVIGLDWYVDMLDARKRLPLSYVFWQYSIKMKTLWIIFVSFLALHSFTQAAMVGETLKRIVVSISNSAYCEYSVVTLPPVTPYFSSPGWAITNYKPVMTSVQKGNYTILKSTAPENKLIPENITEEIFDALLRSELDSDELRSVFMIANEYDELRDKLLQDGSFGFKLKMEAWGDGECYPAERSAWIEGYVEVEELYVGQSYQDILDWIVSKNTNLAPAVQKLQCDESGCRMK
eukprot:TRINITY_DN1521_c0_g1_i8.p1 TRINITY_DN1521_c0_g1~~TRINITY_DN1521_c0_g1_i8.p1  ORF type:complete len:549 (-),score=46.82 TRINITY_DN1521_c0_g1_i8:1543-3165(-)